MNAPQKILVPTDFSQYADKALDKAIFLAKQFGAQIELLHIVDNIQQCAADYCLSSEFVENYRKSAIDSSTKKMKEIVKSHTEAKEIKITTEVRQGAPYDEILKEAQDKKIDLIVIASHGKTGFLGHLGSVADRVSRGAKCEVLLVKA